MAEIITYYPKSGEYYVCVCNEWYNGLRALVTVLHGQSNLGSSFLPADWHKDGKTERGYISSCVTSEQYRPATEAEVLTWKLTGKIE